MDADQSFSVVSAIGFFYPEEPLGPVEIIIIIVFMILIVIFAFSIVKYSTSM